MNVKELIEHLKLLNDDAEVKIKIQHPTSVRVGKIDDILSSVNPPKVILVSEGE